MHKEDFSHQDHVNAEKTKSCDDVNVKSVLQSPFILYTTFYSCVKPALQNINDGLVKIGISLRVIFLTFPQQLTYNVKWNNTDI